MVTRIAVICAVCSFAAACDTFRSIDSVDEPDNDIELALYWYRLAGEGEHKLALNRLADVYGKGELGESVDVKKASLYQARAAQCEN